MSSCTEIDSCLQQIYVGRIDSIIKIKEQLAESTFGNFANQKIQGSIDFIDSVYRAKSNIVDSTFDSSLVDKLNQLDSAVIDSLMTNSWCSFFSQSLDKVIAIHVGLFTALVTVTVAIFLTKYWFDNNKFEHRLNEEKRRLTDDIEKLKENLKAAEKAKNEMEATQKQVNNDLQNLKNDLSNTIETKDRLEKVSASLQSFTDEQLAYKKLNDTKLEIYVKCRLLERCDSVEQIKKVLTEICQYFSTYESESIEKLSELISWIEEKNILKSIFDMIDGLSAEDSSSLHLVVLGLKKYIDIVNAKLRGQLHFEFIDDFFKRFEPEDSQ